MLGESQEVRQQFWPVAALSIAAFALSVGLLAYTLWQDRSSHISDATNNARFVADLMASQTRATVSELQMMLDAIALEIRTEHLKVAPPLNDESGDYLRRLMASYENLMDVLVLDADGRIVQWTGTGEPPKVNDREYARAHIDSVRSDLFVGEPLLSKVHDGKWFFAISEALRGSGGTLRNIVVAIVDIELFRSQFADTELPPESSLVLIRKSGKLITRRPFHRRYVGTRVNDAAKRWNEGRLAGSLETVSPVDGVERIVGFRLMEELGIGAFASMAREMVLADWYRLLHLSMATLACVAFVLVLLNLRIYRDQKRVVEQQRRLAGLARTDELTGLFNRRHVMAVLKAEFRRSKRYRTPLSVLMMDIDNFKNLNDEYGHDCGDAALMQIADTVRKTLRGESAFGRYGGEEFIAVLPSTNTTEAVAVAERIRETVERGAIDIGADSVNMTVSIGVASCDLGNGMAHEYAAIKKADEALYSAKRQGRNRVVAAGG